MKLVAPGRPARDSAAAVDILGMSESALSADLLEVAAHLLHDFADELLPRNVPGECEQKPEDARVFLEERRVTETLERRLEVIGRGGRGNDRFRDGAWLYHGFRLVISVRGLNIRTILT